MDIRQFQELIKKVMETAREQDNRIDVTMLRDTFNKMEISEVQFKEIIAYLAANHIKVEGIPDNIKIPNVKASVSDSIYLEQYMKELKGIGKVSLQEEKQLFTRMKKGDATARERFISLYLTKVAELAIEYRSLGMTLEDLIQEGNIALIQSMKELPDVDNMESIRKYIYSNISKGISDSIRRELESDSFEAEVIEKSNVIYQAIKEYEERVGRKPDIHELVEETDIDEEEILDILKLIAEDIK